MKKKTFLQFVSVNIWVALNTFQIVYPLSVDKVRKITLQHTNLLCEYLATIFGGF